VCNTSASVYLQCLRITILNPKMQSVGKIVILINKTTFQNEFTIPVSICIKRIAEVINNNYASHLIN
jgi:hypothetical protein